MGSEIIFSTIVLFTAIIFTILGHYITAKSNNIPIAFPFAKKGKEVPENEFQDEEIDESIPDWQRS